MNMVKDLNKTVEDVVESMSNKMQKISLDIDNFTVKGMSSVIYCFIITS